MAEKFINSKKGTFYRALYFYEDGSEDWLDIGDNPWELSWAQSLGPYFPDLQLSVNTAAAIKKEWGSMDRYGYCPMNCVANKLYEFGMSSREYEKMLSDEIADALALTEKYPMPGGMTEYFGNRNSWRALPFTAGSFFFSISGQILQSLPMGLAVRASDRVDELSGFRYRLSTIDAKATGEGDVVGNYRFNGAEVPYSLQIPSSILLSGQNRLEVTRTDAYEGFRLFSSSADLKQISGENGQVVYHFYNPIESELVFENIETAQKIEAIGSNSNGLKLVQRPIVKTNKTAVEIDSNGPFRVVVTF
jgi:hypothetical protein